MKNFLDQLLIDKKKTNNVKYFACRVFPHNNKKNLEA